MRFERLGKVATSLRTSVVVLCVLAVLLLLNIAVPQEAVLGPAAFETLAGASPLNRLLLDTLGLGRLPTSPLFLGALAVFFVHLACVLVTRAAPAWRRSRPRPGSETGLRAWARMDESLSRPLAREPDAGRIATILRGYGYQVRRSGERTFWGVKHRTAPLGFVLFHLSFLMMCAGGTMLYYTRFVGTALLTEGQEFGGDYAQVLRHPPLGGPPEVRFTLVSADPRFENGEPTHLAAVLRFRQAGSVTERRARVNAPADWGPVSVLLQQAGLTPVLWLQDDKGYTRDRVAATARGDEVTDVPLDHGRYRVRIAPRPAGAFPGREELATTPVALSVAATGTGDLLDEELVLFDGALRPGEAAPLGSGRLVLEELRYWVRVQVVSERGGGLLIAGFLALVVGLVWRMLLYRREVVVAWDDSTLRVVGRSESFSLRFREELSAIVDTLFETRDVGSALGAPDERKEARA